jgi:hypothetical protein
MCGGKCVNVQYVNVKIGTKYQVHSTKTAPDPGVLQGSPMAEDWSLRTVLHRNNFKH